MKKYYFLLFGFIIFFQNVQSQVTFVNWHFQHISNPPGGLPSPIYTVPGGSIDFTDGFSKDLSYEVTLQKSKSASPSYVGMLRLRLVNPYDNNDIRYVNLRYVVLSDWGSYSSTHDRANISGSVGTLLLDKKRLAYVELAEIGPTFVNIHGRTTNFINLNFACATQTIIGVGKLFTACDPEDYVSRDYNLSTPLPSTATDYKWSVNYGTITQSYFTGSLTTGVKVSIGGNIPVPASNKFDHSGSLNLTSEQLLQPYPDSFIVTCRITYNSICGTDEITKTVMVQQPFCPGLELNSVSIDVFPNPTIDKVLIQFNNFTHGEDVTLFLSDVDGKYFEKREIKIDSKKHTELSLPSGYYIAKIIKDNKEISTRFIVK